MYVCKDVYINCSLEQFPCAHRVSETWLHPLTNASVSRPARVALAKHTSVARKHLLLIGIGNTATKRKNHQHKHNHEHDHNHKYHNRKVR